MRAQLWVLTVALAAGANACRRPLATRPDQLAPGTFAATVHGWMGPPEHPVEFDDRVTGTACRVGTFVLLDSPHRSRMFTVWLPALPDTPTAYPLRARPPRVLSDSDRERALDAQEPAAEGHLNYGESLRGERPQRGAMHMAEGTVSVAVVGSGDLRGTVRARLREGIYGDRVSPPPATADLVGVFRVDARQICEYARSSRSGLTRR